MNVSELIKLQNIDYNTLIYIHLNQALINQKNLQLQYIFKQRIFDLRWPKKNMPIASLGTIGSTTEKCQRFKDLITKIGRKFSIALITCQAEKFAGLFVHYRKFMLLCSLIQATTLLVQAVSQTITKLNLSVLKKVLTIAESYNALCPENQKIYGEEYLNICKRKFYKIFQSSVRR